MPVFSLRALSLCTQMFGKKWSLNGVLLKTSVKGFNQVFSPTSVLSWTSVNELVYDFTSKITNVMDAIAPTNFPGEIPCWEELKKENVENLNAGGEKQISRFIMRSTKRDFRFIIWYWELQGNPSSLTSSPETRTTHVACQCGQANKPSYVSSFWTVIYQGMQWISLRFYRQNWENQTSS